MTNAGMHHPEIQCRAAWNSRPDVHAKKSLRIRKRHWQSAGEVGSKVNAGNDSEAKCKHWWPKAATSGTQRDPIFDQTTTPIRPRSSKFLLPLLN